MVTDEIVDLMLELEKTHKHKDIARQFDKDRKWVIGIKNGVRPRIDYNLIAGLRYFGYELRLEKIDGK